MKTKTRRKKQRISQRGQTHHHRQRHEDDRRSFQYPLDDHQILTFKEWCRLNAIGLRTGRRIIAGEFGPGPAVTRLSPRRIGISVAANRAWQASRERAA